MKKKTKSSSRMERLLQISQEGIQIAIEAPSAVLEATREVTDYDFCIAPYYLDSLSYRKYFHESRKRGRFIILDNGAFELGKPMPVNSILGIAATLEPDVVVAPDVIGSADQTTLAVTQFFKELPQRPPFKIMGVVQGASIWSAMRLFNDYICERRIAMIGLPYHNLDRQAFLEAACARRNVQNIKPVHILGLRNPFELLQYKQFPFVCTADSSRAVNAAWKYQLFQHYKIGTGCSRPKLEEKPDEGQLMCINDNLSTLSVLGRR